MPLAALFITLLGLVVGSFLSAYTYRAVEGVSIARGRSFCPKCKKQIAWYDNIPVLSYLMLAGTCRKCGKPISMRYPLIELTTAAIFLTSYLLAPVIITNIAWLSGIPGWLAVAYVLSTVTVMVAVFVTDLERELIPDEPLFIGLTLTVILLIAAPAYFFPHLLAGFAGASFLLTINLVTLGRGMGLGDVKLAVLAGSILGPALSVLWLFLAFLGGSLVGVALIAAGKQKLGSKIAFGPFLAASFFVVIVIGGKLIAGFVPFLV